MAISGSLGKVYYIKETPTVICDTGFVPGPIGTTACWADEITRFEVTDSVQKREYGHDKSEGWQDVVAGTRRLGITLTAMLKPASGSTQPLRAGRVLGLQLYPVGMNNSCSTPLEGYAMVDQVSYTYDQERGDPISYTMTLSSKGPWTGFGDTGAWGGFEDQCT